MANHLAELLTRWRNWKPPISPETEAIAAQLKAEEAAKLSPAGPGLFGGGTAMPLSSGPGGYSVPTARFSTSEFAPPLPREGANRVAGLEKAFALLAAKRGAEPVAYQPSPGEAQRLKEEYAGRRASRGYTSEELGKQAQTALQRTRKRARRQSQVHQFAANRALARKMRLGQPVSVPGFGGGQGGANGMAQMFINSGDPKLMAAGMEMLQRQDDLGYKNALLGLRGRELTQQGEQFNTQAGVEAARYGVDQARWKARSRQEDLDRTTATERYEQGQQDKRASVRQSLWEEGWTKGLRGNELDDYVDRKEGKLYPGKTPGGGSPASNEPFPEVIMERRAIAAEAAKAGDRAGMYEALKAAGQDPRLYQEEIDNYFPRFKPPGWKRLAKPFVRGKSISGVPRRLVKEMQGRAAQGDREAQAWLRDYSKSDQAANKYKQTFALPRLPITYPAMGPAAHFR